MRRSVMAGVKVCRVRSRSTIRSSCRSRRRVCAVARRSGSKNRLSGSLSTPWTVGSSAPPTAFAKRITGGTVWADGGANLIAERTTRRAHAIRRDPRNVGDVETCASGPSCWRRRPEICAGRTRVLIQGHARSGLRPRLMSHWTAPQKAGHNDAHRNTRNGRCFDRMLGARVSTSRADRLAHASQAKERARSQDPDAT